MPPDEDFDWAVRFEGALRSVPLAAGALGIGGVLANRLASGVGRPRGLSTARPPLRLKQQPGEEAALLLVGQCARTMQAC